MFSFIIESISIFLCLSSRSQRHSSELHANCLAILLIIQVPRVRDHELEVLVVVDRGRHIAIVVNEFVERHLAIALLRDAVVGRGCAMSLERLHEVLQHFVNGLLARLDIRVVARIIQLLDVVSLNNAVLVEVDLLEDALNQIFSERRHFTLDSRQQFIEVNLAGLVAVKQIEQAAALLLAELQSEVAKALPELLDADNTITSVVEDLEDTLKTDEAASTSGGQAISELLHELIVLVADATVAGARVAGRTELVSVGVLVVEGRRAGGRVARQDLTTSHGRVGSALPVSTATLGERSLRVAVEQVAMMVLQVLLTSINLGNLLSDTSVRHGGRVARAVETPRVRNHEIKVGVIVDVDGDIVVVLDELLESDHVVVLSAIVQKGMVLLEGVHEFLEHLFLGLLAGANVRVHGTRVMLRELLHADNSVAASIKLVERALHQVLAELVHLTNDDANELIKRDLTSAVQVDRLEQVDHILLININIEVVDHLLEFGLVQLAITAVVTNLELSLQTNEAVAATLLQGLSEALDEHGLELGRRRLALDLEGGLVRSRLLALATLSLTGLRRERNTTSAYACRRLSLAFLLAKLHGTSLVTEGSSLLVAVVLLSVVQRVQATLLAGALHVLLSVVGTELDRLCRADGLLLLRTVVAHASLVKLKAPSMRHNSLKSVVSVARGRQVMVEVHPLVNRHAIVVRVAQLMVSLERLNELVVHSRLSADTHEHIGMSFDSESLHEVSNAQHAAATESLIKMMIRLLGELGSSGGEGTAKCINEFAEMQSTVTVFIKLLEENRHVLFADADAEVSRRLDELGQRQRLAAIIIHDGEEALEADHAAGSSSLQLVTEQLEQSFGRVFSCGHVGSELTALLLDVGILGFTAHLEFILEEAGGELLVVELAVAVLIARLEDVVQGLYK